MTIIMTLYVWNEEDVIESNIDYHQEQGVDFFIITDNMPVDSNFDRLRRYERAGLAHLIREPADDHPQTRCVTHMARLACTDYGADWVINNDADEFWWPRCGTLRSTLEAVPKEYGAVVAPRHNFIPRAESSGR